MYQKYIIKQIDEADFGCEGRPEGYIPVVKVYLEDEFGMEMIIDMEDAKMYERQLDEGVEVIFGEDGTLYKADSYIDLLLPDESIGHMADKQSDWLDEYMDAIEKMEE